MTPEKIYEAQLRALNAHQALSDLRFELKTLGAAITLEACGQMRPDGKPILSNDLVRQAAITRLQAEREDYMTLRAQIREAEARTWRAQADLELQRNLFAIRNEPVNVVLDGSKIQRPMHFDEPPTEQPACLQCGLMPMRAGSVWCSDTCASMAVGSGSELECGF